MRAPTTALRDGTPAAVRPLGPEDKQNLAEAYLRLSPESQHARFLSTLPALTPAMLTRLVDHVDGVQHVALLLSVPTEGGEQDVAVGRFVRDCGAAERAEIAVTVADEWQGRGAGSALIDALRDAALELGVTTWTATVLAGNSSSVRLLERSGEVVRRQAVGSGLLELEVRLTR